MSRGAALKVSTDSTASHTVNVADTLMRALRLVDEVEAVARLVEEHLVETGPSVAHAAARLLGRTSAEVGRELCRLLDHDDAQRRRRSRRRR